MEEGNKNGKLVLTIRVKQDGRLHIESFFKTHELVARLLGDALEIVKRKKDNIIVVNSQAFKNGLRGMFKGRKS